MLAEVIPPLSLLGIMLLTALSSSILPSNNMLLLVAVGAVAVL